MAQPQLASFSSSGGSLGGHADDPHGVRLFLAAVQSDSGPGPRAVRRLLRWRSQRANFFSAKLFADPAWDILLELYAAELEQRRVSVGSLCIASRVPATTALRWIATLVGEGLIKRHSDPLDARRIFVTLAPDSSRAMAKYFQGAPSELVSL